MSSSSGYQPLSEDPNILPIKKPSRRVGPPLEPQRPRVSFAPERPKVSFAPTRPSLPSGFDLVNESSAPNIIPQNTQNTQNTPNTPNTPNSSSALTSSSPPENTDWLKRVQTRTDIPSTPLGKPLPGEKQSSNYNRMELRINTLVSMLSVVIGVAALIVSITRDDKKNKIISIVTLVIISVIAALLLRMLLHEKTDTEDLSPLIFGIIIYLSIISIFVIYWIES